VTTTPTASRERLVRLADADRSVCVVDTGRLARRVVSVDTALQAPFIIVDIGLLALLLVIDTTLLAPLLVVDTALPALFTIVDTELKAPLLVVDTAPLAHSNIADPHPTLDVDHLACVDAEHPRLLAEML
jgi:hypothetical protein